MLKSLILVQWTKFGSSAALNSGMQSEIVMVLTANAVIMERSSSHQFDHPHRMSKSLYWEVALLQKYAQTKPELSTQNHRLLQ